MLFSRDISIQAKKEHIFKQFERKVGYKPNFDTPLTFNEKLQWLKLYHRDRLITECSDKLLVRNYVSRTIGDHVLVKLYAVYKNAEQLYLPPLPSKFILKSNNGSGTNYICNDKRKVDIKKIKQNMRKWLEPRSSQYFYSYEWGYKNIMPRIICEQLIKDPGGDLKDYKFFCFNGKVKYFSVCSERSSGSKADLKMDFFDLDWNKLPFTRHPYENNRKKHKKPSNFQQLVNYAEKLSKPFPFVRVDFYVPEDKIIFGEMTFYPSAGLMRLKPPEWDKIIGEYLTLPKKSLASIVPWY